MFLFACVNCFAYKGVAAPPQQAKQKVVKMQTVAKQLVTNAIATYCTLRAKGTTHAHAARATALHLHNGSAATVARKRAARMRSAAGLAELAAAAQIPTYIPFVSADTLQEYTLSVRTAVRAHTLQKELAAVA